MIGDHPKQINLFPSRHLNERAPMYKVDRKSLVSIEYKLTCICDNCKRETDVVSSLMCFIEYDLTKITDVTGESTIPPFWGIDKNTHQLLCHSCYKSVTNKQ